ncbi:MAG TPA: hypothetical protein DHR80_13060 [Thalassospira lucentensis]|uniref:Uncharacterized protein n=1 Tax=Thalassospira lucentensis TaxID=168935 RepID=A0A3D5N9H5_9PROT|nr:MULTISPECIES: hypothetical protein [Thalassospira]HCW68099.1 hypothetical protein [Thalassospira lucentensis]
MSIKTHGEKPSFLNTVGAVISVINRGTGLLFWSVSCLGILFLPETLILIIRAFLALDVTDQAQILRQLVFLSIILTALIWGVSRLVMKLIANQRQLALLTQGQSQMPSRSPENSSDTGAQ